MPRPRNTRHMDMKAWWRRADNIGNRGRQLHSKRCSRRIGWRVGGRRNTTLRLDLVVDMSGGSDMDLSN